MDKVDRFFAEHNLHWSEKKQLNAYMVLGFSFNEAFFEIEKRLLEDYTMPDGSVPSEVQSFSTTANWLREGVISLDKPSRLAE